MATTTTNYGLKKYEGADYFNPLTYENANADAIDQAMFDNKQASVGAATELVTGTVHAITRANADTPYLHWTATANFNAGDTYSVDGTTVTALNTAGETLEDKCIITGADVFAILRGTALTVYYAKKTDLSGIQSDIADLQADVSDLQPHVLATVTGDAIKTVSNLLDALYAQISGTLPVSAKFCRINSNNGQKSVYSLVSDMNGTSYAFSGVATTSSVIVINRYTMKASASDATNFTITTSSVTPADISQIAEPANITYTIEV